MKTLIVAALWVALNLIVAGINALSDAAPGLIGLTFIGALLYGLGRIMAGLVRGK